jgi:phage shock protein B
MNLWTFIVVCVICATVCRLAARRVERCDEHASDDTRVIQEIHRGLRRMEQRIEALETIVIDDRDRRPLHARHE